VLQFLVLPRGARQRKAGEQQVCIKTRRDL